MKGENPPPLSVILVNIRDRIELVLIAPSEAELGSRPGRAGGVLGVAGRPGRRHPHPRRRPRGRRPAGPGDRGRLRGGAFLPRARLGGGTARRARGSLGRGRRGGRRRESRQRRGSVIDFGPWSPSGAPGPATELPIHQTSYKRALLLPYGSRLDILLDAEAMLQKELREQGHELYFQPAARTNHVNVSRLADAMALEFHNFRVSAVNRARQGSWPWHRRALYVACSPLFPLLHLRRILGHVRRSGRLRRLPAILPPLIPILASAAAGEALGFSIGEGRAPEKQLSFELDRLRHINDQDRRALVTNRRLDSGG